MGKHERKQGHQFPELPHNSQGSQSRQTESTPAQGSGVTIKTDWSSLSTLPSAKSLPVLGTQPIDQHRLPLHTLWSTYSVPRATDKNTRPFC